VLGEAGAGKTALVREFARGERVRWGACEALTTPRPLGPFLKQRTFCVYDGPTPEAIRAVADRNGLPVDRIEDVRVLDPYFHC
jgi:hypothetical protein